MNTKVKRLIESAEEDRYRIVSLLVEEINKQRLVVFVGAGCSMSVGLPSWSSLIEELMEKNKIRSNERDIFRLASRLERELGPSKFREKIVERLRVDVVGKSTLHDALIALETFSFITTNYDTILEDYFKLKGISPAVITNFKDIPSIDPTRKTILKLHGDLNSPTSLVITTQDYSKYKKEGKAYIDWLESIAAQKSILFIGASFDDPRLKDVDDYVLNIFGRERRQPFIFFKIPESSATKSDEDFEIEIDDFEALCDDFRERGFYLILVRKFEEIANILNEVNKKVLEHKLKTNPDDLSMQLKLKEDYSGQLKKTLDKIIDERIKDLVKKVLGEGRLPGMKKMRKGLDELIDFLDNSPNDLKVESRLEGLLCIINALLILADNGDIINARRYYNKANGIFQQLDDKAKFKERLIRLRAKLLFEEGLIDDALDSIAKSEDPKTISFWLTLMADTGRIDEALEFIETHEGEIKWIEETLRLYVLKGKITEAEHLFWKVLKDFVAKKREVDSEESEDKGDFFIDRLCFVMIHSIYSKAQQQTGNKILKQTEFYDIKDETKQLFRKSIEFVDKFLEKNQDTNPENDYRLIQVLFIEMSICHILGDFARADKAAKRLVNVEPLNRQVIFYILMRMRKFPETNSVLETILTKLVKIHPAQHWSMIATSIIQKELGDIESSWDALKRAFYLSQNNEEQNGTLLLAVAFGIEIEESDEVLKLIQNSHLLNDDEKHLWEGLLKKNSGQLKEAVEIIDKINESNLSVEQKAGVRRIRGENEIENQNWEEARKLLYESLELDLHPETLRAILFVLTKLKDEVEILRVIERFESFGIDDDQVTLIKAQATRNLRQFERSEASWRKLKNMHTENPEYAFGLAHVLMLQMKEEEAVEILKPFVQPDEKLDLNCLHLSVQLYSSLDDRKKAFSILNDCYDKIQDHPELLHAHLDLGYSIRKEEKAAQSFERLQILNKDGNYSGKIFTKVEGLEEIINLIKKKLKKDEKLIDSYSKAEITRLNLCDFTGNNSLYLDWAIRTQSLPEDFLSPEKRKEFTIYSTNSFRVILKENLYQFERIEAPKNAEKIVIDYHALITIHRLGLMDKLSRRYDEIAYPEIFKRLWKMEQLRYAPHQLSKMSKKEKAKTLVEKLDKNEIKAAEAPVKDSRSDRSLSLAHIEKCPLVDNYIKEEELVKYPDVPIIRLPQLLDWMYEKSRISENEWEKAKKYTKGEPPIGKENRAEILSQSMRFVIDRVTLDLMEEFDINRKLIDMGAALFIEKDIASEIRFEIRSIEFINTAAGWHRELFKEISENPKFVEVQPDYSKEKDEIKKINEDLYLEAVYAPIKYCSEKEGFLLTDDRLTQKWSPGSFGTDALLKDLFEQKIIDIAEYTNAFLTLCKWRYRFLLPDIRVLVFLARQYKKNLPGKGLELVASYLRKNMENPGLSCALEPTSPPVPIAYKYYRSVIDVWLRFLAAIWQDDETFGEKNLLDITDWFYLVAMPAFPEGIPDGTKTHLYRNFNDSLSLLLFSIVLDSGDHKKLHKFFKKSFEKIFSSDEEKELALIKFIRLVKNFESPKSAIIKDEATKQGEKNYLIVNCLETFFGKDWGELEAEILQRPKLTAEIPKGVIQFYYQAKSEDVENILKALEDFSQPREDMSEYRISPLITIKRTPIESRVYSLFELIKHPDIEIKRKELELIFGSDFITDFTKNAIEKLKERLLRSSPSYRQAASEEVVKLLSKDFQYGKYLIEELKKADFPEWPRDVFYPIWRPDLSTVMFESRLLFNEKLNIEDISGQIRAEMNRASGLADFLDWILEECFFVPLGPPLNPWRFIEDFIKKKKISNKSALSLLKRWIQENNDPLAYLIGLEVVLNLRARAEENEINEFKDKIFFEFLTQLFEVLFLERREDAVMDKHLFENIRERWLFRTKLSRYYLMYIDLNFNKPMEDECKVMLAWWMAREFEKTLIENSRLLFEQQTLWLIQNIELIEGQTSFKIEHLIKHKRKGLSVSRYHTLVKAPTLTALTLAIIAPNTNNSSTLIGLKKPTIAFRPNFTNAILNALPKETLFGEEHIPSVQYQKFRFLWESPFCSSAPRFLRTYYDNDFELLGEEKVNIVILAETISDSDFLKSKLPNLLDMSDEEKNVFAPFLLSSLDAYVQLHGEMPSEASVFEKNRMLIKDIMHINPPFSPFCFQKVASIFDKLISVGDSKWVAVFREQLENLDYSELASSSDSTRLVILEHVLNVVISGYDLSILYPIIFRRQDSKAIREILSRVKSELESIFIRIPIENRENVRKFLNQIADVPAISSKKEA